jgi:hypothetical protein
MATDRDFGQPHQRTATWRFNLSEAPVTTDDEGQPLYATEVSVTAKRFDQTVYPFLADRWVLFVGVSGVNNFMEPSHEGLAGWVGDAVAASWVKGPTG